MIFINNDIVLEKKEDLDKFVELMEGETYNDESRAITNCITSFLYEIWDKNQQLTEMIHRKISKDLFSIVIVDISETASLDEIQVKMFSKKKDFKILAAHKIAFEQFCNMYFISVKPLYNRFSELDL